MLAFPTNVYIVEMTLRSLTTAENILLWLTRPPSIFQMFLLLTLSTANANLLYNYLPSKSGFCLDIFVLPLCKISFFFGDFAHKMSHISISHKWNLFNIQTPQLILPSHSQSHLTYPFRLSLSNCYFLQEGCSCIFRYQLSEGGGKNQLPSPPPSTPRFVVFANCGGINTPTMAHFKLPVRYQ